MMKMMETHYIDMAHLFPRDNLMVQCSHDHIFISILLSTWNDGDKYFSLFIDDRTEKRFYLKEDARETYYHPITGEQVKSLDDWRCLNKLRYSKLLKRYRTMVYSFRQHLHQRTIHDKSIILDGIPLFENCQYVHENFDAINNVLKWPLRKKGDPILDRMKELRLIKWENISAKRQHPYQRVCPVDGVVTPRKAEIKSPDWTWGALVGRLWTYSVCPHCLYEFSGELTTMS